VTERSAGFNVFRGQLPVAYVSNRPGAASRIEMSVLEQAAVERASGEQVSRTKSFLAAAAAGFAAAALTYKLLRSGGSSSEDSS
jgi:hypothetical protein